MNLYVFNTKRISLEERGKIAFWHIFILCQFLCHVSWNNFRSTVRRC